MGVRGRRERERPGGRECCDEPASHASERLPPESSASPPSTIPIAPTTSATIASVELDPPPPKDDLASIVADGVSEDSGPLQSTTDPSE
jgi:hypothetical protein